MDLKRTDEQQLIIDNVRRLIREEIRPLETDLDPDAYTLPPTEHERLVGMVKEMGLYQMDIPVAYGGPGVDIITRTMVAEETSQHRAGSTQRPTGSSDRALPVSSTEALTTSRSATCCPRCGERSGASSDSASRRAARIRRARSRPERSATAIPG